MHTKWSKLICVIAALALLTVSLTSCDFSLESFFNQDNGPEPVAVSLKTDLKDAKFTFTYGQLKEVLPTDLLATLFENYDEKTDDVTIELNYNDLKSRYSGDEELFQKVLGLLTESDREALAATGLSSLGDRMTSELSGGQQQLLAVAGVLAMRPRYLVLDEAGSQLDEATRARLADIVDALLARGVGVLEVAHAPEAVFGATRVLVMSEGTPVRAGAPRDFLGSEDLLVRSGLSDDALAWAVHEGVRSGYVPGRRLDAGALAEHLSGEADLEGRDGFFAPRAAAYAPAGPSVDLRDVSVTYGDVRALADVSLAVSGITLLLGVSGSGKTTAARVLAGVQEPDEGEAALDGRPVVPGDVGLAFQRPEDQLFADTVFDDLA